MQILQYAAEIAAVILIVELMVVLLIFLGVSAGLAFGLRWVNGKTGSAFGKMRSLMAKGTGYIHTGTDYAALPVIVVRKYAETAGEAADAIKLTVRQIEAAREVPSASRSADARAEPPVAARPVPKL
jgi:hypothetical protein